MDAYCRKWLFVFLLLVVSCYSLFSLGETVSFKQYTAHDGLSQSWIRCIYQDSVGFVWLGTSDGVSRFDGRLFKTYRPKSVSGIELGGVNVSSILQKDVHQLWVASDLGVFVYDVRNDQLLPVNGLNGFSVFDVCKGKQSDVWFATNKGVLKLNEENGEITEYSERNSGLASDYINVVLFDSNQNLWVGTNKGVCVKSPGSVYFTKLTPSEITPGDTRNDVRSIKEDIRKRIWVGYSQDGLYCFTRNRELDFLMKRVEQGRVVDILFDSEGFLWVGKGSSEGLYRGCVAQYDSSGFFSMQHFTNDPRNRKSISDNSIFSLYEDYQKNVWIGTFGKGVNFYSPYAKKFHTITSFTNISIHNDLVNAIAEDQNYLYIGTEGGLDVYNKQTNQMRHYHYQEGNDNSMSRNPVYDMHLDRKGNLWLGTWLGGVNCFNPDNEVFQHYLPSDKNSISSPMVFAVEEDCYGNMWFGTLGGGLNKYDVRTGTFTHYLAEHGANSVSGNRINDLLWTSDSLLLISCYDALDVYSMHADRFIHYPHSYADSSETFGDIIFMYEDRNANIWLATNSGLELFDYLEGVKRVFTVDDGLPDNVIMSVVDDNQGNLWIGTGKGVAKFVNGTAVPAVPVFELYTVNDGIASNELKKKSVYKNDKGFLFFGSSGGLTVFDPSQILKNDIPPRVIIKKVQSINSVSEGFNKIEYNTIHFSGNDKIVLSYRNSDFVIHFSALNYVNPLDNMFEYKLEGYDNEWIKAGDITSAMYTNMQPGSYIFKVRASNNDGVWIEEPRCLFIDITPPWWKTIIFKIVVALAVLSFIVLLFNLRVTLLKRQKKHLAEKVKARTQELEYSNNMLEQSKEEMLVQNNELSRYKEHLELLVKERTLDLLKAKEKAEESDRLKSSFLSNMSHEIRTPMNAIVGFVNLLLSEKLSEERQNEFVALINSNVKSLLLLIDDIIDISLIEADQIVIKMEAFSLMQALSELHVYYEIENKKPVTLFLDENRDIILVSDPVRFKQIVNNLLNNALKYTHEGEIHAGYVIEDQDITFYVSDTGIGIDEKHKDDIFNHFQKIEDDTSILYRGAGIGLSINKKLVELLGGQIWVKSQLGEGSTFYFTLPRNEASQVSENPVHVNDGLILSNFKILIAEDEVDNYRIIEYMLKHYQMEITWAVNGKKAVEFVEKCDKNENILILMDLKMPEMDGYEALENIRLIRPDIPVIAVTACTLSSDRKKIADAGFADFVAKPVKTDVLIHTIKRHSSNFS